MCEHPGKPDKQRLMNALDSIADLHTNEQADAIFDLLYTKCTAHSAETAIARFCETAGSWLDDTLKARVRRAVGG